MQKSFFTQLIFKISIVGLLLAMLVSSCKEQEVPKVNIDGKTIKEIKSNVIYTEDGQSVTLNQDSISKIFYLVRHAEKDTSIAGDPPLTEEGINRATKIADIMRGTRVDAIYSTMTLRTMFTVDSLSDIKAMQILPYDNKTLKETLEKVKYDDEYNRIFMVGHSNTIPSITNTLAGRDIFTKIFDESDYGNFVIVVANKSGSSDVYKLRY
ncbi:MAG TPA: phosphoglycerate mutase family protein [Saprospiraceae bacterium]|nr:phosphoglycerate mutase family protein [Saprospiraceae bacterium]